MTTNVKLSTPIAERLQTHANKIHLPLDALVERMITDSLPIYETNGFHRNEEDPSDDVDDPDTFLARIAAQIQETPPNPAAVHLATKSVHELVADLQANPPSNELLTFEEMWSQWQAFEQALKVMDEADAIREGRL